MTLIVHLQDIQDSLLECIWLQVYVHKSRDVNIGLSLQDTVQPQLSRPSGLEN